MSEGRWLMQRGHGTPWLVKSWSGRESACWARGELLTQVAHMTIGTGLTVLVRHVHTGKLLRRGLFSFGCLRHCPAAMTPHIAHHYATNNSSSFSCTCMCITDHFFSLTDTAASASAILLRYKQMQAGLRPWLSGCPCIKLASE